jgi:hypothetical protein
MIELRRRRGIRNAARMGRRGMHIEFRWESQKERHPYEDVGVNGRIILKWILEKYDGEVWTGLIWFRIRTCVNTAMNLQGSIIWREILEELRDWWRGSFRRTRLYVLSYCRSYLIIANGQLRIWKWSWHILK